MTRIDLLFACQHLHDIVRHDTPNFGTELRNVDGFHGDGATAHRRQIASVVGKGHLRVGILALEDVGEVLCQRLGPSRIDFGAAVDG